MKPWLLETAEEYKGKVKVVAVDVDNSGDVAQAYEVEAMPTFVILKDGKELDRVVGGDKKAILEMMDSAL